MARSDSLFSKNLYDARMARASFGSEIKTMPGRRDHQPFPREQPEVEHQDLNESVVEYARDLSMRFNERYSQFGVEMPSINIAPPKIPLGLTTQHLKAIEEVIGRRLQLGILPRRNEIYFGSPEYVKVMYPEYQHQEDTERGIISYRSTNWNEKPQFNGYEEEFSTEGELYLWSMQQELDEKGGSLILLDDADEVDYRNLFQWDNFDDYWGEKAQVIQSFMRSCIGDRISQKFQESGLTGITVERDIEIDVPSAVLLNHHFTFHKRTRPWLSYEEFTKKHPRETYFYDTIDGEWTSTRLSSRTNPSAIESRALIVGITKQGGAAEVHHGNVTYPGAMNRLALRFKPPKETLVSS